MTLEMLFLRMGSDDAGGDSVMVEVTWEDRGWALRFYIMCNPQSKTIILTEVKCRRVRVEMRKLAKPIKLSHLHSEKAPRKPLRAW
jgi:hypothetical protein